MRKITTRQLSAAGIVGALYAVLSIFGSVFGITFGPVQCRFSEALCVLPFFLPETVWGLFIGCLVTNILSPYGPLDMVVGSLATLLAAAATSRCKNRFAATLPPVIANMTLVGGLIAWQEVGFGNAFWKAFAYHALTIGAGEAVACCLLGSLLLCELPKIPFFRRAMAERSGKSDKNEKTA